MFAGKKIFLLFILMFQLAQSGNFHFSIDDGATDVKNHLEFYIYADKRIKNSHANANTLKSVISIKKIFKDDKKKNIQEEIEFNVFLQDGNTTIKVQTPSLLNSHTKYSITLNGSKILDKNSLPYEDNNISFTSSSFTKIVLSEQNITIQRGSSGKIFATLDSFLGNDTYELRANDKHIRIYPERLKFNQLNWNKPQEITITFLDGQIYKSGETDIIFENKASGFKSSLSVKLLDSIQVIFNKKSTFTFEKKANVKMKLSKSPPESKNDTEIALISKNKKITISPNAVKFNHKNWDTYQDINISANTQETIQDFIYISVKTQPLFQVREKRVFVNFINSDVSSLPIATIKNTYTSSLYANIIYSLPLNLAYKIRYKIYATQNKIDYSETSLITETIHNKAIIPLYPNKTYEVSIIATYEVQELNQSVQKTFTYNPIKINTNKITFLDANNNILLDDIEELLTKLETPNITADTNNDKVPDSLQIYSAKLFGSNNFSIYDNYKDSDGDKVPDLLEVSIGRSPIKDDFHPPSKPVITKNENRNIYLENIKTESLHHISKIQILDGSTDITHKAKAYYSSPCFNSDKLPYRIFTKDCKEIELKSMAEEKEIPIHWVIFDADHNIDYKKQVVKLFKGKKTISYKLSNFSNSIKSADANVLFALGKYSKIKNENNISLKLSQIPNSSKEKNIFLYENNIFDFKAYRVGKNGSDIIIPQIKATKKDSELRIYKDNIWTYFDTSGEDKVFTSTGRNKKCDIPHQYYTEGIIEGAYCLKIRVKDGSKNDSDSAINDIFHFTGGISISNEFVTFETKQSNGCSSLNARGFSNEEQKQTKTDPVLPMILILSLVFLVKSFTRKT